MIERKIFNKKRGTTKMFKVIAVQPESTLETMTQILTKIHSLESQDEREPLVKEAIDTYFEKKLDNTDNKWWLSNPISHVEKKGLALINKLIPPEYSQTINTLPRFILTLEKSEGTDFLIMPYTKMVVLHIYHKTSIQGLLENLTRSESDSDSSDTLSYTSTPTSSDKDPLHTLERSASANAFADALAPGVDTFAGAAAEAMASALKAAPAPPSTHPEEPSANPFADASAPGVDTFAGAAAKAMAAAMAKRAAAPAPSPAVELEVDEAAPLRFFSSTSLLQFKIFSAQFATYGPISLTVRPGEKENYEDYIHTGDSQKDSKEKFEHYHKAFLSDPKRSSGYTRMAETCFNAGFKEETRLILNQGIKHCREGERCDNVTAYYQRFFPT
jgi:hypothetical protein